MARGSEPGKVVRYEPPPEPPAVAIAIAILTVVELAFVVVFLMALFGGWNSVRDQQFMAFLLANALVTLSFILILYRRYFLPDIIIVKQRRKKLEDLINVK